MSPNKTPTIFVALRLTPDQFGLFEEVEAEGIDVLNQFADPSSVRATRHKRGVLIDRGCIRIALGWMASPDGDALTLAVGLNPEQNKHSDIKDQAVAIFRELVARAEALLEIDQALWQIAALPLTEDSMGKHTDQLESFWSNADQGAGSPFVTFRPEKAREPVAVRATQQTLPAQGFTAENPETVEPSWAMQASALTLSTAFVLVTPPVGIAMFTYAVLRQGKSMDLLPRNLDVAQIFPAEEEAAQEVRAHAM